jgi:branched-chain amino acid transport system substrate-binding protein
MSVSFVGSEALAKEMGSAGEGVIITQVVPSPNDSTLPIVKQYQADMKKSGHQKVDYVSLEGYINAKVIVEALKKAGKELSKENFLETLKKFNGDIGGMKIGFSKKNHQGLKKVYFSQVLKDGRVVKF